MHADMDFFWLLFNYEICPCILVLVSFDIFFLMNPSDITGISGVSFQSRITKYVLYLCVMKIFPSQKCQAYFDLFQSIFKDIEPLAQSCNDFGLSLSRKLIPMDK